MSASCIAAYISVGSEVETQVILNRILDSGKVLILPRVNAADGLLLFYRVEDLRLDVSEGYHGIIEPMPKKCPVVPLSDAGMILIPGVLFSESCERIGYGGGFYDRNLKNANPYAFKVGVGFDFQIIKRIPVSPQDRSVNAVISETFSYGSDY